MKLPNGYGSITKMSGKRRNPYRITKTIGYDDNGKQIRETIGYAKSYTKALELLTNYNQDPYDIDESKITFEELFNKFITSKEQEYEEGKISKKSIDRYKNAYKYYESVKTMTFISIKKFQLQKIIDDCKYGYDTKSDIKTLYNFLYKIAVEFEMPIKRNYFEGIDIGKQTKSDKHKSITNDDLKILWEHKNDDYVGAILIQIYCGLRPTELLTIKEIHLDERYMIGGIKTESGIDRIIPINEKIVPFIEQYLLTDKLNLTYRQYSFKFKNIMKKLKMDYTPHDCRHTLATLLDNANANDTCTKIILGHKINDITKGTYTHKTLQQLLDTINLI